MIETLVAEIAELETQKEKYSTLLGQTEIGTAKYDAIKIELDKTVSKLETKESELNEQRDQAERRAQQQEESLDALATFVTELGLYRLAKPVPEDGERLTEYTEMEKAFNEIVYFGYRDYTKSLQDEFNRQDDAQVRFIAELNRMNVESNKEYTELERSHAELDNEIINMHNENAALIQSAYLMSVTLEQKTNELDTIKADQAQKDTDIVVLTERVKELTEQLEKKPVAAPQLSGSLQDKIASFKQNSKIKSSMELVLERLELVSGKASIGGEMLQAPPLQFNIPINIEGNQLPAAEATEAVEQFRTPQEVESAGPELADESSPMAGSPVTREEFEVLKQEVATLKEYVQGLEGFEEVA